MRRVILVCLTVLLSACSTSGETVAGKRSAVQEMRQEALAELYKLKPDVRSQISDAAGYGVFSNANVNLIFASVGGGYGVVTDNASGLDTYMKMGELGVGFGAGVKDFRIIMVFHTPDAMQRFEEYGLAFSAQADAAAKASDQGLAVGGEATVDNITVYQLTQTGLALQATIKGTRFWRDNELN